MCLAAGLSHAMASCQTLAFVRWKSRSDGTSLKPNGPAIKGVCVTRRQHRQSPGSLASKLLRCKEGMACVFAVRVRSWFNITRVAVQTFKVTGNYQGIVILLTALAQCRGTSWNGARNWSRCRSLIVSIGAKSRFSG